jgi:peptide deformylase
MAILKIARMGHPVLCAPAQPISDPMAPDVRRLVEDMIDSMDDAGGLGLAAPQVHVPRRVVIFHVPGARAGHPDAHGGGPEGDATDGPVPFTVLINPVIDILDEDTELGWEGCLSVPGLTGLVPRYKRIRYAGVTLEGERLERLASGFHARVVQHECDHLDGILYPQRMTDLKGLGFVEEIQRYQTGTASGSNHEG